MSVGAVDQICQRTSQVLELPHERLTESVLCSPAVNVDETGWGTWGAQRTLWTATTPEAAIFRVAEDRHRDRLEELIGKHFPGIVCSDRWWAYQHLDPDCRRVCWEHLKRDFRHHSDGTGEQQAFGEQGGWFKAVADALSGPELRQVMPQRDPAEREALEQLHDDDPEPYLELKRERSELEAQELEDDALEAILADWNRARSERGLGQAVMIARDNATRAMLNERARELLIRDGALAPAGALIADQEFRLGDRVIARRNDRYRDIDNGTLAVVTDIEARTGALTVITDAGARRVLDASYVAERLEHAYALTGHGAHGATVEWAGVVGRPSEFSREWAYTSLSRARGRTRVYVVSEPPERQRQREEYAPPEPERTKDEVLDVWAAR